MAKLPNDQQNESMTSMTARNNEENSSRMRMGECNQHCNKANERPRGKPNICIEKERESEKARI
jgi:hypothetical protein